MTKRLFSPSALYLFPFGWLFFIHFAPFRFIRLMSKVSSIIQDFFFCRTRMVRSISGVYYFINLRRTIVATVPNRRLFLPLRVNIKLKPVIFYVYVLTTWHLRHFCLTQIGIGGSSTHSSPCFIVIFKFTRKRGILETTAITKSLFVYLDESCSTSRLNKLSCTI